MNFYLPKSKILWKNLTQSMENSEGEILKIFNQEWQLLMKCIQS